ncbi:MAG: hypothetical protein H7175_00005 [Burkholderiales bacterium]|nr:hypothetical protein [Anaerolineae bacterium]
MRTLRGLAAFLIVLLFTSASAQPETSSLPPFAAIFDTNIHWFDAAADSVLQLSTEGMDRNVDEGRVGFIRDKFTISPDGTILVYAILEPDPVNADRERLYFMMIDLNTGERTELPVRLADISRMHMSISLDNQSLLYNEGVTFYRLPLTASGQPTPLFALPDMSGGGGGGSSYPSDPLFWLERGGTTGGARPILAETPLGLVFTPPPPNSIDDRGVYLYDFEQSQAFTVSDSMTNAALSADRTQIAGVIPPDGERPGHPETTISVVDLQTLVQERLTITDAIDNVTWGPAGSNTLYYSTRRRTGDINLDLLPFADREQLFSFTGRFADGTPVGIPRYEVGIFRYDLTTGASTRLYYADAWAIGRMFATPDSSALVFSQVTGLQRWVSERAAGIDYPDPYTPAQTDLYRLDLTDNISAIELVGVNVQRPTFAGES